MDEANTQYYTGFNNQKIKLQGSHTESIPVSGGGPPPVPTTVTITPGISGITSYRFWAIPGNGRRYPLGGQLELANDITILTHVTTTTIVFQVLNLSAGAVSVTFYYRVYYDTQ